MAQPISQHENITKLSAKINDSNVNFYKGKRDFFVTFSYLRNF